MSDVRAMFHETHATISRIREAGDALAQATRAEMELENRRPLVKAAAIRRLMESGAASSATAAEKIVEQDAEYADHRRQQVEAAVARQQWFAAYEVAKLDARLAVALFEATASVDAVPQITLGPVEVG